mgnify:CR=1 FL=1
MKGIQAMAMMKKSAATRIALAATLTVPLAMLGGCVTISAPDKPIVINLNINIKQEVVYRLDGKAKAVIDENAEIF